ncbi:MAG TPA: hypothetical protein DD001_06910 [Microcoleaceae bacterium UBA10368]|nr:hypothetical protein [Microcoleaceae cyanobacterium UBA10368]HCV29374.1 hypothetical protein [Microcoleaceae cyanobacterium UBA9251]
MDVIAGIGNWALGIGHWALGIGIGHRASVVLERLENHYRKVRRHVSSTSSIEYLTATHPTH